MRDVIDAVQDVLEPAADGAKKLRPGKSRGGNGGGIHSHLQALGGVVAKCHGAVVGAIPVIANEE